ncbi:MAG: DNA repair protein RecN [Chlorobi bacterium]|nr:DNA repair protein RecN [Chlorobiota bacterium]
MLKSLQISNYALIDELGMELDKGLTIVSGETGAGKSIILGALDLITGKRADTSVLLDKSRKCIVEAMFLIGAYHLEPFFVAYDLDYEDPAIIRREISPAGKSRAFINDTPVTLPVLQELGKQLIDIHSQHENILLSSNRFQLNILDTFASHERKLNEYRKRYAQHLALTHQFETLQEQADKASADLDYLTFQHTELEEAGLEPGELTSLEKELEILTHAEEISSAMFQSWQLLSEQETAAVLRVKESMQILRKIIPYYPDAEEYTQRLESALLDIQDLAQELDRKGNDIEYDPHRLESGRERISLIYHLLEKHHLKNEEELIALKEDLAGRISRIASYDKEIKDLEKQIGENNNRLQVLGQELSDKRRKVIPAIEKEITGMLKKLGMPAARFSVRQTVQDNPGPYGFDEVSFLFTANPQVPMQDVRKVASGGELSRLMLSLKSLLSATSGLPTIIFDEIDAGVSGDVADRVGEIIDRMGISMQVINITHLPQIASKGQHHYRVYKTTTNGHTYTRVKLLSEDERISEIARLLSGRELSEAAFRNARELLGIK